MNPLPMSNNYQTITGVHSTDQPAFLCKYLESNTNPTEVLPTPSGFFTETYKRTRR